MKIIAFYLFISIILNSYNTAYTLDNTQQLEDTIIGVLEKLSDTLGNKKLKIVAEDIYLENTEVVSPFSSYLKDMVISVILKTQLFDMIQAKRDYSRVKDKAFVYAASTDFDAILLINYYIEGDNIKLYFKLNKNDSPEILAGTDRTMPKTLIPDSISIKPVNFDNYKIYNQGSPVLEKQDFNVVLWAERGSYGIYKDGERLVLKIKSDKDCYIKLLHTAVDGKITLIFPNKFENNNFIKANETYEFPSKSMGFDFVLGEPYGIETIHLIAQDTQFEDVKNIIYEGTFKEEGNIKEGNSQKVYTRGLKIIGKGSNINRAEAIYIYNIVK